MKFDGVKQTYATQEYHLVKDVPQHGKLAPANTIIKLTIIQLTYFLNTIICIFFFLEKEIDPGPSHPRKLHIVG